jgi:membrane protein DedA with SNARE-associated domain
LIADLGALLDAATVQDVFLAALVEKFIPVLPSYVLFPAVGMGAHGVGDLLLRCLVAAVGSLGGALGWYLLGAGIGAGRVRRLVERHGRWVLLSPVLYERMSVAYRRRPFAITLLGQLVPTVRIFQALPAGVLRLPLRPFLVATAIGSLGWIVPLATAGHVLRLYGWSAAEAGLALLAALVAIEGTAVLLMRRRAQKIPGNAVGAQPR